jgi:hypothetical protein
MASLKKLFGLIGATLAVAAALATIFSILPETTRNQVYVALGLLEPSPTWTVTPTSEPTQTPTSTFVPSETFQPTQTLTPTSTSTPTKTSTPTIMPLPTMTATQTPTAPVSTTVSTTQAAPAQITPLPYPCPAQIIFRSSSTLNVVRANPSTDAPLRNPVQQGASVTILAKVEERRGEVWYQIADMDGRSLGWIIPEYVILSESCPS